MKKGQSGEGLRWFPWRWRGESFCPHPLSMMGFGCGLGGYKERGANVPEELARKREVEDARKEKKTIS